MKLPKCGALLVSAGTNSPHAMSCAAKPTTRPNERHENSFLSGFRRKGDAFWYRYRLSIYRFQSRLQPSFQSVVRGRTGGHVSIHMSDLAKLRAVRTDTDGALKQRSLMRRPGTQICGPGPETLLDMTSNSESARRRHDGWIWHPEMSGQSVGGLGSFDLCNSPISSRTWTFASRFASRPIAVAR